MVLRVLLDDIRAPSCTAAAGEHRDEGRGGQAERLQHKGRVELDVRLQVSPRFHVLEHSQHNLLDVPRQVEKLPVVQYGTSQLFRRPDVTPAAAGGTTSAYFDDFNWTGTGSQVPNATWSNVVTGDGSGANQRYFGEACYDPDGDWSITFSTGIITNSAGPAYNYTVWGFVDFAVPNGTVIGAGLDFSGEVQRNTGTATGADGRIMVSAERTPLTNGVKLICYQASGGADDVIAARLHVRRFELFEDVYTCVTSP